VTARLARLGVPGLAAVGLAVACGVALGGCSSRGGLPESATTQGESVIELWRIFLVLAVLVALLIWVLTCYVVITGLRRRRAAEAEEAAAADGTEVLPRQKQYNLKLEIFYTAMPVLLVSVLLVFTFHADNVLTDLQPTPALTVKVTGFQWQWQFEYDQPHLTIAGDPGDPPTLVLPVGRVVRFELHATDVIHSFWVPEFLEKRDLIPGIDNQIQVEVQRPGEWVGRCAEYCGFNHGQMTFDVQAIPADQYDAWAKENAAKPQPVVSHR